MRTRLLLFTITIILFACNQEEKQKYEDCKSRYSQLINATPNSLDELSKNADFLKRDMQTFVLNCSDDEYKYEINRLIDNIDKEVNDMAYKIILNDYNNFEQKSYTDYAEYKDDLSNIQFLINTFISKFPNSPNLYEIKQKLNDLKNIETNLAMEKNEYDQLVSTFKSSYNLNDCDIELNNIDNFLTKYPNTIKKGSLQKHIESVNFVKVKIYAKSDISSIYELNNLIMTLKTYKENFSSSYYKNETEGKLSELENRRSNIFDSEFDSKLNSLLEDMDNSAKSKAKDIHSCGWLASNGISQLNKSQNGSKVGNRVELDYLYTFKMKGGFWCDKKFITKIRVIGTISGNEEDGVSYNVTSTYKIDDYETN